MILERLLRSPLVMIAMLVYLGVVYVGVQEEWPYGKLFIPFFTLFIVYFGLMLIHNKKHPARKIKLLTYIPYELREEDEGMQWVTFKATRKVYIFYYFAIPIGIVLVTMFHDIIPYFVIWLLVALGVIQYLIYWMEMRKVFKEE